MNMKKLADELNQKNIDAEFVHVNNEKTNQERVYLNIDDRFDFYLSEFEDNLFLNVWIKRNKEFFSSKIKISETQKLKETILRRKAKFKVLLKLKELGIEKIEECSSEDSVFLAPKKPRKENSFMLDLGTDID